MPGLVEEASGVPENLSKAKGDKDRLLPDNKVLLLPRTEILELKAETGSLVASH